MGIQLARLIKIRPRAKMNTGKGLRAVLSCVSTQEEGVKPLRALYRPAPIYLCRSATCGITGTEGRSPDFGASTVGYLCEAMAP